jgi:hypothetical protein
VREENDIVVADELVEVDLALVGLGLEVGGSRAETDAADALVSLRKRKKRRRAGKEAYGSGRGSAMFKAFDEIEMFDEEEISVWDGGGRKLMLTGLTGSN